MRMLSFVLLCLLCLTNSFANEPYVSYQIATLEPDDDNFKKNPMEHIVEAGYSWKYVELGLEASTRKFESTWSTKFRDTSLLGTIKGKLPIGKFVPYIVFGVGEHWFTNKKLVSKWETILAEQSIAFKYGGGLEFMTARNLSFFGECAYRYGNTGDKSTLDSWGWSYSAGVKVKF